MVFKRLLIAVCAVVVGGCAIYPVTRTYYQVDPTDGTPKNRASCGYTSTRDSAQRVVEGIEIFVSPGKTEDVSGNLDPSLDAGIRFSLPVSSGNVAVDSSRIEVVVDGVALKVEAASSDAHTSRRLDGNYKSLWLKLRYPPPSGLKEHLAFVFQPGAVLLNGRPVVVAPFRFARVTKSDIYYGSINC